MEVALCQNALKMQVMLLLLDRLFFAWITTNKSRGTGGADGSASAATTDATTGNRRALTQAQKVFTVYVH